MPMRSSLKVLSSYEDVGGVCVYYATGKAAFFDGNDLYKRFRVDGGRVRYCVVRRVRPRVLWVCCECMEALRAFVDWLKRL